MDDRPHTVALKEEFRRIYYANKINQNVRAYKLEDPLEMYLLSNYFVSDISTLDGRTRQQVSKTVEYWISRIVASTNYSSTNVSSLWHAGK